MLLHEAFWVEHDTIVAAKAAPKEISIAVRVLIFIE
jgi:hypothetical protein